MHIQREMLFLSVCTVDPCIGKDYNTSILFCADEDAVTYLFCKSFAN